MVVRRRDRVPALAFAARGTAGEQYERGQHDEVLHQHHGRANTAGQHSHQPHERFPQAIEARLPQQPAAILAGNPLQLHGGVVHMEHLIAQHFVEHGLCCGIVRERVAINGEVTRGILFGYVEEGEQRRIIVLVDADIVETAFTGCEPLNVEAGLCVTVDPAL